MHFSLHLCITDAQKLCRRLQKLVSNKSTFYKKFFVDGGHFDERNQNTLRRQNIFEKRLMLCNTKSPSQKYAMDSLQCVFHEDLWDRRIFFVLRFDCV